MRRHDRPPRATRTCSTAWPTPCLSHGGTIPVFRGTADWRRRHLGAVLAAPLLGRTPRSWSPDANAPCCRQSPRNGPATPTGRTFARPSHLRRCRRIAPGRSLSDVTVAPTPRRRPLRHLHPWTTPMTRSALLLSAALLALAPGRAARPGSAHCHATGCPAAPSQLDRIEGKVGRGAAPPGPTPCAAVRSGSGGGRGRRGTNSLPLPGLLLRLLRRRTGPGRW